MAAIAMHLRASLRSARFGTLGLILLVGVAGGVVLSAAAGARRTETAFPRFLASAGAADALVSPSSTGSQGFYAAIRKLPQVEETSAEAACMEFALPGGTDRNVSFGGIAPMDDRFYTRIERPKILAGRLPRSDSPGEAFANERLAREGHLSVGQQLKLLAISSDSQATPAGSPTVTLTIVGIGAFPGEVVPSTQLDTFPVIYLTPAYLAAHPEQPGCEGLVVRLRPGSDVEPFRREANTIAARSGGETGGEVFFQNYRDRNAKVVRAIRPQAIALWLFALLSGATFLIVIGQILGRQAVLSADSNPILRSLGMTRQQLFVTAAARTGIICVGGGLIAVAIAVVTSPLMPIGPARIAEPDPGLSVNAGLLGLGFAGVVVLMLAVTLVPMWRAASGVFEQAGGARSHLARTVADTTLPPSTGIGIGMALEPGSGRNAVPVRSALIGAILAVAAGVTAVIFGANLDRLVSTPRLYGWRWDAIFDTGFGLVPKADIARIVGEDPAVAVLSGGHYGNGNVTVNGRTTPAVGIDRIEGDGFPRITEGKPPGTTDEIVLGVKTARRAGARLGSTVSVSFGDPSKLLSMKVVGMAVFPALGHGSFEPTGLGEGLAVTAGALAADNEEMADAYTFVIVGYKPGTDRKVAQTRLESGLSRLEQCQNELCGIQSDARPPADISNYSKVRGTPIILAGAFALLAAATLGHTLVTSVNRRRRDLAVMKTLGFVRRQISMTIAWQASTVAGIALLFGIPLGIAAGRWTWQTFADQLGVPLDPSVPLIPLLIAIPATLLLANVIAAFPARSAGRTRPALVLRSE